MHLMICRHIALVMIVFSLLLPSGSVTSKEKTLILTVSNGSAVGRPDEVVAVPWSGMKKMLPSLDPERVLVFEWNDGGALLSQSTPDELLFRSSFAPHEVKTFVIRMSDARPESRPSLVDGKYMEPRQDFAWENDRIAFRIYGPALAAEVNDGIDVWTKRVRGLVIQKWYKGDETPGAARVSYHEDHGEGADFFDVGRSLGCGGVGIWSNGRLYQPGVFTSYRQLANGPLRTSFEVTYDKWDINGLKLREVRRISLDAGRNLNRIDVTFFGGQPEDTLHVVSGLVKRPKTTPARSEQNAWISLWGQTNADLQNGSLGTGVIMDRRAFEGLREDSTQYLIGARAVSGRTLTYYAGAGWTRSGDFATADDWTRYLQEFSINIASPLMITIAVQEK
jgi:pectinesterase